MKIKNIERSGEKIRIEVDGVSEIITLNLKHYNSIEEIKESIKSTVEDLKLKKANLTKMDELADQLKVGDTIA